MRMKREGGRRKFGGTGGKEGENCRQRIQKSSCLQENLNIFIASIYMESRKVLKERMRIVCCLCYGKGKYPEKEVAKIVEVTTR